MYNKQNQKNKYFKFFNILKIFGVLVVLFVQIAYANTNDIKDKNDIEYKKDISESLLIRSPNDSDHTRQLANLFSASAGYSLWVNQIRNGSGNKAVSGALPNEGYFSQFLRVFSLFDLYFTHGVKGFESKFDSNASLVWASGFWTNGYLSQQPSLLDELVGSRLGKLISTLNGMNRWELRSLNNSDIDFSGNQVVIRSQELKQDLYTSVVQRYHQLWYRANPDNNDNQTDRLQAMADLARPLSSQGDVLVRVGNDSSTGHMQYNLPAPGKLITPDKDDPSTWYIQRKIDERLPKPVSISFAELNRIYYQKKGPVNTAQAAVSLLRVDTYKDYDQKDKLRAVISFGRLARPRKSSNDIVDLDTQDNADALHMTGSLTIKALKGKTWAKPVLDFLARFNLDVAFHKLAFVLNRPRTSSFGKSFKQDDPFKPVYDSDNSHMVIKVAFRRDQKAFAKGLKKKLFEGMGFTCNTTTCVNTYTSTAQMNDGFFKKIERHLVTLVTVSSFKEAMPEIQNDADDAIAQTLLKYLADLRAKRDVLLEAVSKFKK